MNKHLLGLPEALEVSEEKQLVLEDRSTDRGAKLVLNQFRIARGKEVSRVDGVVPVELEEIAVQCVRAGFQRSIDDPSHCSAELSRQPVCLYLEFLNRIQVRLCEDLPPTRRGDRTPVQ